MKHPRTHEKPESTQKWVHDGIWITERPDTRNTPHSLGLATILLRFIVPPDAIRKQGGEG